MRSTNRHFCLSLILLTLFPASAWGEKLLSDSADEYLRKMEHNRHIQGLALGAHIKVEEEVPPLDFVSRDCEARGSSMKMLLFDCFVANGLAGGGGYLGCKEDADVITDYVVKNIAGLSRAEKKIMYPLLYDLSVSYRKTDPERSKTLEASMLQTVREACDPADLMRERYLIMLAIDRYSQGDRLGAEQLMDEVCQGVGPECSDEKALELIDLLIGSYSEPKFVLDFKSKRGGYAKPISKLWDWRLKQSLRISMLSKERPREHEIRVNLGETAKHHMRQ